MITIASPMNHIASLWNNSYSRSGIPFRLMRYVIRTEYNNAVYLHNVVTGQLVSLNQEEAQTITTLPTLYSDIMKELVNAHFLVPVNYDEHSQVVQIRNILRILFEKWESKRITKYTIIPTTSCNARCYYCFEQGRPVSTMSVQVADDVVNYISTNYDEGENLVILWFGGEPTVASGRIDQISKGLNKRNVIFSSRIMTNGYLLDKDLAHRAKELWQLRSARICFDGDEEIYNKTKNYYNATGNPYNKVMDNITGLLDEGIFVNIRMNFDIGNADRFIHLVQDVLKRFGKSDMISVTAHPVIGEYRDLSGKICHGDDKWFEKKTLELNEVARSAGLSSLDMRLPSLEYKGCSAARKSAMTITPEGNIVRCLEQYELKNVTGNIYSNSKNEAVIRSWKKFADYDSCSECVLFPVCGRIELCAIKEKCYYYLEYMTHYNAAIINKVQGKENEQNED